MTDEQRYRFIKQMISDGLFVLLVANTADGTRPKEFMQVPPDGALDLVVDKLASTVAAGVH